MPTVSREGVQLYYERHGDEGEPLMCIMGLGGTIDFWEFQTPVLARDHRVVIYDNRGAGRSDKPAGPYSTAALAEDAVAVLDACGFSSAHVLGLSMGGMIAQELALAHPDRLGALILAATFARPDAQVRAGMEASPIRAGNVDPKMVFRIMTAAILTPEFVQRELPWLRALRDRVLPSMSVEAFLAQAAATMAHDTSARLGAITAPTLIMMPTGDQLVPPSSSEELARLIPGSTLQKFEQASHGFNVEQADKFNRAVLDFVARHPLPETRF
jgi:pimeloyl-ACP methyl ester carboxylesterase